MDKQKNKIKILSIIISIILVISIVEGFTFEPASVKADILKEAETTEHLSEEETASDPDAFNLIAHRGYSGYAPENSMPAFEKAIEWEFSTIELDIIRCKPNADGTSTWVVSHNNSLKNTMGVNKNISELTYNQVLQYSYTKGNNIESYSNLKIVSLNQIIALIKKCKQEQKDIKWQIELKDYGDDTCKDYYENEVVRPIMEAEVDDCVIFSSFHYTYLKKIKSINPDLHTWFLSTILDKDAIGYAKKCGADGISFKGTVNYTTKDMIQAALDEGFRLGTYTLNTPVSMGVYYLWGVRQFATDMVHPMELTKKMLEKSYNITSFTSNISQTSYTYDGKSKQPKVTVSYKGIPLIEGVNYVLRYSDNKNPGTASVYISGINNCTNEKKFTYKISMPKVTGFSIPTAKTTYVKLSWKKVKNVSGYIIYAYNYNKKKYEEIKRIKNADTVSYKVKSLSSATKYRYRVKTYLTANGKTYTSDACTGKTIYTRSAKTKKNKVKRYGNYKKLKITWTGPARCTGYQIKVSTDKAMKKVVGYYTIKGKNKKSFKIKKLAKNKTYYVKIRSYLKVGNKTYNGVYSKVMKSKGKK